jgi:hypothetical protein
MNQDKTTLVEISAMLKNILARHKAGEDIMDRMAERIQAREFRLPVQDSDLYGNPEGW